MTEDALRDAARNDGPRSSIQGGTINMGQVVEALEVNGEVP